MSETLVFPLGSPIHIVPPDYVRLEYKLIHKDAKVPFRKRETDAGYDLHSIDDVDIQPHETENIRSGIILACPAGYYLVVEGRSSMYLNCVAPFHAIIDATYTGEMMVRLMNIGDTVYHVKKHDRIAQVVIHKAYSAAFVEVDEFSDAYNQRGTAGFGSSGK
ncbi:MAG: dUTP diphosphatase [Candidatus Cloacimonetes bacterium]|jgi:dUTP pyrophosphatase|nr:dUTP diphosphatase [Candidatus Cloacimonadota bacterium]